MDPRPAPRRSYRIDPWLISLLLLGVAVRCLFSSGFVFGTDDMGYSDSACRMVRGAPLDLDCKYSLRFGLTGPLAVLYSVLGMAPAVNSLFPLLCAAALAWIVHRWAMDLTGAREDGLWACALALTIPVSVFWSTVAFPDVPLAFAWTLGLYLIHRAERDGAASRWPFIAAGLVFAYGEILSPAMLYIFPVLGLHGAARVLAGKLDRRIFWTVGVLAGALLLEMALYRIFAGDFFFRWRLEWPRDEGAGYPTAWSRLRVYFWPFLFGPNTFGLILPFTLIGLAVSLKHRKHSLLVSWLVGYLAVSIYNLLTVFLAYPRYLNVLAAPAVILAVVGMRALWGRRRLAYRAALAVVLAGSLAGTYRACMGTALTRTDPLVAAASFLKGKDGPVWTQERVWSQLRFYWKYEDIPPCIPPEGPLPAGKAYVVIDEVLVRTLNGEGGVRLPPEWLDPPPGWKKLIHIPGYRPYPGVVGKLVETWFPRDRSLGVDVYEVGAADGS
jgi:4-amino-4-deoxy-L-arabinose transferase-like glycosyltransferase